MLNVLKFYVAIKINALSSCKHKQVSCIKYFVHGNLEREFIRRTGLHFNTCFHS